jgi:Protein of unknown function (DUF2971)
LGRSNAQAAVDRDETPRRQTQENATDQCGWKVKPNIDGARPLPRQLFKYMALNRLREILDNCKLYFPSPDTFNDPFDCRIYPKFNYTAKVLKQHYEDILKAKGVSRSERRRQTKEVRPSNELFEKAFEITLADIRKTRGVLCFSETREDILMWSHYGDKHSGVCLCFDTKFDFFEDALPVRYASEYPKPDFVRLLEDQNSSSTNADLAKKKIEQLLYLTKSDKWKYEKEWRLGLFSITESTIGFHPFPPEALKGIILGVQFPKDEIESIKRQVQSSRCEPELLRAVVSRTDFALEIYPVS